MKPSIHRQIKLLDSKIDQIMAQRAKLIRSKVIPDLVEQMHQGGITPRDIAKAWKTPLSVPNVRSRTMAGALKGAKPERPAKYRNPETGDTWSGLGKRPAWLRAAEESGRSRSEFLIATEETQQ
ncbi:H-NS histone family protein [Castellaniella sp.]|uniref:H-NS histone family protein n=1 Tax=Castellaniella sp. TaxID=1955812 RepID=UPI002AFFC059|nr:H-NS histone family protein [Castellaniella sp.]